MTAYCYILFSPAINKFYVGSTGQHPEDRLKQHNESFFGSSSFSARTNDWRFFIMINCISIEQALRIEKHIKKMHSRKYYNSLKEYPEIIEKLLEKYK